MEFKITKELIEKLANYLVTKPWIEANGLLQELQTLKPIEAKQDGE